MKVRLVLAVFFAILLIISLWGFILTYSFSEAVNRESIDEQIEEFVSTDIPEELNISAQTEEEIEEYIKEELEGSGFYSTLQIVRKVAGLFFTISVILALLIVILALGSALIILGVVLLIVGIPFLVLNPIIETARNLIIAEIPSGLGGLFLESINLLVNGVAENLAVYTLSMLILGVVLLGIWFISKFFGRKNQSKEKKKK